jgi:hypothetical protein
LSAITEETTAQHINETAKKRLKEEQRIYMLKKDIDKEKSLNYIRENELKKINANKNRQVSQQRERQRA